MTVRIQDVAKRAGVSSATVSRVLSGKPHVRDSVKARVLEAVESLGYQPNRIARSLRVQRSSVIGLIISDIQNSFFNTVVRAVEDVAYENGYAVFLCNSDEDPEKERLYLELFQAERVAGVILTPTGAAGDTVSKLLAAGIPVVSVDRRVPGVLIDAVLTNNEETAFALVTHLIAQGHERIAALVSDPSITTGFERLEGYRRALSEAGLAFEDTLVRYGRPVQEDGYALTTELLTRARPPSALFAATKLMGLGALRAIYDQGLEVPDDIALAAFDKFDWMPFMPMCSYAEQPTYGLGKHAAELLLSRVDAPERAPKQVVLASSLHILSKEVPMPATAQAP